MPTSLKDHCEYRLPDIADEKRYRCAHSPDADSKLCIFHRPKPSKTEKAALSTSKRREADEVESAFALALLDLIEKVQNADDGEPDKSIDMRGFYFPSIHFRKAFSMKPDFSYATFVEYGDLESPKWKKQSSITFKQGALFYNAHFVGRANFAHTVFELSVDFNGACFMGEVDFSFNTFREDAVFSNCDFKDDAKFWSCRFEGSAEFDDAEFGGFLYCSHAVFTDVNFFGIEAKGARFGDCVFGGPAHIHVATFESFLEFDRAQFDDVFNFDGCTLPLKTRFEKTDFRGECLFTALEIRQRGKVLLPMPSTAARLLAPDCNLTRSYC